ncbi:MAG: hypothetical protein L0Y71_10115 [Gemmataceae bacterium]|nr:hypothetical protein [Gemmataceae bacterium]
MNESNFLVAGIGDRAEELQSELLQVIADLIRRQNIADGGRKDGRFIVAKNGQ